MTRGKRTVRVEGDMSRSMAMADSRSPFATETTPNARGGYEHDHLAQIIAAYKSRFDDWSDIATWPLESGLKHMSEKLKG